MCRYEMDDDPSFLDRVSFALTVCQTYLVCLSSDGLDLRMGASSRAVRGDFYVTIDADGLVRV